MKRKFKAFPVLVSLIFAGASAQAGYVGDSAQMARKIFQQNVSETGFAASNTNSGPMGTSETINHASNVGKNSQEAGAAANNAAGVALIATGTALLPPPTTPTGAMLIGLGIMALMQGAHDSNAAGQSAATGAASVLKDGKPAATPYGTGDSAFQDPKVKEAMKKMNDLGYKVSAAGITKPDGSFVPASALSSPSSMAAAGVDSNAVKEVQKVNTALADELTKYNAKVSGVAVSEGSGGASANEFKPGDTEDFKAFNPFAINADAKKKLMAGKTVSLDGEPIGVSGANIFEMVHEAYQKKRSGAQFIETDEAVRAPASVRGNGKK